MKTHEVSRRPPAAHLVRVYLVVVGAFAVVASFLAGSWGIVVVGLPVAMIAMVLWIALAIMRRNVLAGATLASAVYLLVGAFFIYADLRYALEEGHELGIPRDVGSAFHNNVFPHAALVVGLIHLGLAAVTLFARRPQPH